MASERFPDPIMTPEMDVNYILGPGLTKRQRAKLLWEMLRTTTKIPTASRMAMRAAAKQAKQSRI